MIGLQKISLPPWNNSLDCLSTMIGLQNYGPWFDIDEAEVCSVIVDGFGNRKLDLTLGNWTCQVTFSAPEGSGPLALDLGNMEKGQAWINGQSIGRSSFYLIVSVGYEVKIYSSGAEETGTLHFEGLSFLNIILEVRHEAAGPGGIESGAQMAIGLGEIENGV
ncbi:hypothetical protein CRG98_004843 [Punica granatum]|uniref:Beta-galactosidase galactose-binding domain-containing protein n=1 Tax=Punica granatum TaxID=22663 RepID=A0A2I0L1Z9_PUNGR|nr:hypothetical protein CRG98_004843 [Punica granatum]